MTCNIQSCIQIHLMLNQFCVFFNLTLLDRESKAVDLCILLCIIPVKLGTRLGLFCLNVFLGIHSKLPSKTAPNYFASVCFFVYK